jgi:hypothetical protein
MKKIILILACAALSLSTFSVFAAPAANDKAERVRLSKDLHDIRNIRERINATIAAAAESVPAADREDFAKYIQLHIDYDALEAKSVQYVADVYTVPELKAMIAYFGSADGQSAEAKGAIYSDKIGGDIAREIDAAILAAKYDGVSETVIPKTSSKLPNSRVSPDLLDAPRK